MSDPIRVLHVDDDERFGELVETYLQREDERFELQRVDSAAAGLDRIEDEPIDCVVSDYEMPGADGIEFLDAVREEHPDLPFVLFTGKGSEEVASEAISAGATDYLQKSPGGDQFTLLANRVRNAVEQYRSRRELERERSRMQFALESTDAAIWTRDLATDEMACHPTDCPVFGVEIESFEGFLDRLHPEARDRVRETIESAARSGESYSVQFRFPADGDVRWGEMNGRTVREGDFQTGIVRDITTQKERKRRFETLTSNLPGMVYRCRNEPGWPMEDVRGNVAEFTGYTAAELETHEVEWGADVTHPADREWVWEQVQDALDADESFEITYRIRTADDETRWVWERGRGIHGPEGELEALEGFITDVTARKRREQRLEETNRRFQSVLDTVDAAIFIKGVEGHYQLMNPTCRALLGVDADADVTELTDHDLLPKDVADRIREDDRRVLERGETVEIEEEIPTADGAQTRLTLKSPLYDDDGEPVGISAVSTDISDRKRRERERRRNERRFESMFEDPNILVGLLDPDGTVRDVNDTAMAYVDADREAVVGEPFPETPWWGADNAPDVREWIDRAADGEYVEFEAVHPVSADELVVEGTFRPVVDDDGTVVSIIVSAREITERRRHERRLERQNEQFDRLASVVSHDLQAPVSTVKGRLDLALETGDLSHVEDARSAIERLDDLRQDLIEMLRSREIVGETERVDVADLATTVWEGINRPSESTLTTADEPRIEGDPDATKRLLQNLLSNAVEHADGHTRVRVGPLSDGFYVEDDGPGIDAHDRDRVFKAGFSTKSGGTGMGMASVKQVVDEHGWEIEVDDAETLDGARFEITA